MIRDLLERSRAAERGYAVILTALMIVPLLGFAGFAVDVGAWYSRASSLQRAADAASLAGVVMQPNFSAAEAAARATAARNGFTHGVDNVQVLVTDTGDNKLKVEIIDTDADLYFSGLFLDSVSIGRQAIAQYNEAVALGSPSNYIGQQMPAGCDELITTDGSTCSGLGPHPGFFLDVGGPRSYHIGGEAFATRCASGVGAPCTELNPEFDPDAYIFAIDVPPAAVGSPITVEIFDPSHAWWAGKEIPRWPPGSHYGWGSDYTGTVLEFSIFQADGIGLTSPTTTPIAGCTESYDDVFDVAEAAQWVTLCTFTPLVADLYPLKVRSSGFAGYTVNGVTQDGFSMRAISASATQPSFYALEYLPLLSNAPTITTFTFAEILDDHAGKTIRMRLFDAGDSNTAGSTFILSPLDPTGAPVATCQYRSYAAGTDPTAAGWNPSDSGSQCSVTTRLAGVSLYNDLWLDIDIDIPTTYSCGYCWWSVYYDISAGASFYERTVWSVQIVGDPVRLLE